MPDKSEATKRAICVISIPITIFFFEDKVATYAVLSALIGMYGVYEYIKGYAQAVKTVEGNE